MTHATYPIMRLNARSDHAAAPHPDQQHDGEGDLDGDHDLEPVRVMRERDALEVHPVHAGHDDEGNAERADDGEALRDGTEPVGDLREVAVERAAEQIAIAV